MQDTREKNNSQSMVNRKLFRRIYQGGSHDIFNFDKFDKINFEFLSSDRMKRI